MLRDAFSLVVAQNRYYFHVYIASLRNLEKDMKTGMDRPRPPPPPSGPTSRSSGSVPHATSPPFREVQETRFVIGLDYGTTYTGIHHLICSPHLTADNLIRCRIRNPIRKHVQAGQNYRDDGLGCKYGQSRQGPQRHILFARRGR